MLRNLTQHGEACAAELGAGAPSFVDTPQENFRLIQAHVEALPLCANAQEHVNTTHGDLALS